MRARIAAVFAFALALLAPCSAGAQNAALHETAKATAAKVGSGASEAPGAVTRTTGFAAAKDGTRIYYERLGAGPAIVFIHGLGGNHAVWFQQTPFFAKDHTVVTMSQRGFAPSGGDQTKYDVGVLVEDLTTVLDAAGISDAVIVGQSMGGWTALAFALTHPQRTRALVLADTVAGISDDAIAAHQQQMIAKARALSATPPPLGVHPALSPQFSKRDPAKAYLYQTLATFGSPAPGAIASQLAAARVDDGRLKQSKVPTLFVLGDGDTVFPPQILRDAASHVPDAKIVEIKDSGHSAYYEQPAAWNEAVARFVAQLR